MLQPVSRPNPTDTVPKIHSVSRLGGFVGWAKFEYLFRKPGRLSQSCPVRQHQTSEVWFVVPAVVLVFLLQGEIICEPSLSIIFPRQEEILRPPAFNPVLGFLHNLLCLDTC